MTDAVLSALITGGLALIGVIISNMLAARKTEKAIAVNQAVTDTKLEELTREVREHNHFARRMPVLEEQMKNATKRIGALEKYHVQPLTPPD